MEEKYKAYLKQKESVCFWEMAKRKYFIVVVTSVYCICFIYIVRKADDLNLRAVLGYLVIVFFSLIALFFLLHLLLVYKEDKIEKFIYNDKELIEYIAKKEAESMADDLENLLKGNF